MHLYHMQFMQSTNIIMKTTGTIYTASTVVTFFKILIQADDSSKLYKLNSNTVIRYKRTLEDFSQQFPCDYIESKFTYRIWLFNKNVTFHLNTFCYQ